MPDGKGKSWYPWLRALAEGVVGIADIGGPITAPITAPAKALLKLADELAQEESAEKFQEVAEQVQQILDLLPDELASRADIAEQQTEMRRFLTAITDASDERFVAEIKDSHAELAGKLEDLRNLVRERIYPEPTPDATKLEEALQQYISYLLRSHGTVELRGVRADQPVQIDLKELYVDLRILPGARAGVHNPLEVQQILQNHRKAVFLGGPGSGKSTLLKRIILDCSPDADRRFGLQEVRLPIHLPLHELAKYVSVLPDEDRIYIGPQHILNPIVKQLAANVIDLPTQYIRDLLEQGRCLLLFDALDEVPSHQDREQIMVAIDAFMKRFPDNRYVIASRPYAYRDRAALAGDVFVGSIAEFSTTDVTAFLDAWYDAVKVNLEAPIDRDRADELREDLKRAAVSNPRIVDLARNPLMLANIAIIHYSQRKLPDRRAELYDLCTELMFGLWDQHRMLDVTKVLENVLPGLDAKGRREFFEPIAWWFHQQRKTDFAAEPINLTQRLQEQIEERLGEGRDSLVHARLLLNTIVQRSGLFQEQEDGNLKFTHHTFQEYLAARNMAFSPEFVESALDKLGDSWWGEVVLLAAGHLSAEHNQHARDLLQSLIEGVASAGEVPGEVGENCLFAGRCLIDVGATSVQAGVRQQVVGRLEELLAAEAHADIHPEVASVLSQITEASGA